MTLRIETVSDTQGTTIIRPIGRIRAEHLDELKAQIKCNAQTLVLDLEQVTLVDVDVVRFLGICHSEGTELLHCSPYIHEWIARER